MNHTIQLTAEQFEALQSGQSITIEPPKQIITKWTPQHEKDSYFIDFSDESINCMSYNFESYYGKRLSRLGFTYKTRKQAVKASYLIRSYARQLAWLAENDDGWVADWNNSRQGKYYIYFSNETNKVLFSNDRIVQTFGLIYMSQANAEKLAQLMNDGIVEF